jgi:hypothetical protein
MILMGLSCVAVASDMPATGSGSASATASGELTIIADGKSNATIVLPPGEGSAIDREAAQILSDHVLLISGARVDVKRQDHLGDLQVANGRIVSNAGNEAASAKDQAYILVGESDLTRKLGISSEDLGPGGIHIRTTDNALILLGPGKEKAPTDPYGTRYAVNQFLEDYLGCRFLWPGELGKIVPPRKTIALTNIDVTYTPKLGQRGIRMGGMNDESMLTGLGVTMEQYQTLQASSPSVSAPYPPSTPGKAIGEWYAWHPLGGDFQLPGAHAYTEYWEKYGGEHPGWFAVQDPKTGSRDQDGGAPGPQGPQNRARLCMSNLELIEHIAQEKIREWETNGHPILSIGNNDGGEPIWCMCEVNALGDPGCKTLDVPSDRRITLRGADGKEFEYVPLTDRAVWFWNQIAERVTKAHLDAKLLVVSYSVFHVAPQKGNLHPSIILNAMPAISYTNDRSRQLGLADWDGWASQATEIYFRPNLLWSGADTGAPLVFVHKLVPDIRHLAGNRLKGTDFDAALQHWATQGLNVYALAKALWNPDIDPDALIDDYCKSGFGSAAEDVKKYYLRIEELTSAAAAQNIGQQVVLSHYTPQVISELRTILDHAAKVASADDKDVRRRVDFLRSGLDFTEQQADVERLWQARQNDKSMDETRVQKLGNQRYQLMQNIFTDNHFAVNTAWIFARDRRVRELGWQGPAAQVE